MKAHTGRKRAPQRALDLARPKRRPRMVYPCGWNPKRGRCAYGPHCSNLIRHEPIACPRSELGGVEFENYDNGKF